MVRVNKQKLTKLNHTISGALHNQLSRAMPPRIDLKLERIGESEEAASSVKAGDHVELRTEADGSLTCTSSGDALGSVPAADAAQLAAAPYTGTIRTVRRQPVTNNVVELIVRFVSGPVAPRPPGGFICVCRLQPAGRSSQPPSTPI